MRWTLETVDPRTEDARAVLVRHLTFADATSPPEHVHALDLDGLLEPAVTMVGARRADGTLAGIGALKRLDDRHAELKSMHVLEEVRGQGVGRAMVAHLLELATAQGYRRVSLETGAMAEFAAARALYESFGFEACEPFGHYTHTPYSLCMTLELPHVTAS